MTQRELPIGLEVQGATVPGPDGRVWGQMNFTVFNAAWRIVLPPELLERAGEMVTAQFAELLELVRQGNGETLIRPTNGRLILPPEVKS